MPVHRIKLHTVQAYPLLPPHTQTRTHTHHMHNVTHITSYRTHRNDTDEDVMYGKDI